MTDELEEAFIGDGEPEYSLVMPFVVTTDSGGPYDSQAFVAGTRFQQLWTRLDHGHPDALSSYEFPGLVPQLELLAMHFGYLFTHEPWADFPDEWELCRFVLPGIDPEEEED